MTTAKRAVLHVMAAIAGSAVALLVVLAAGGSSDDLERNADGTAGEVWVADAPDPAPSFRTEVPQRTTILAWSPGGLPTAAETRVRRLAGIADTALVGTRLEWLTGSVAPDGSRLDAPPDGLAIPIEVAVIDPTTYATFVAPSERQAILSLGHDEVLLSRTSSRLRRAARGAILEFGERQLDVVGELSDVSAGGYEAIVVQAGRRRMTRAFLLAEAKHPGAAERVTAAVQPLLGPGTPLRIRTKGETPFLRYGDAVPPQLILKKNFGEFAARSTGDGSLEVERAWRAENIASYRVPVLGRVTCHRLLAPLLRSALRELRDRGRSALVDPSQYAGCYFPRFVNRDPDGFLSHHSWGVALDVNSSDNPFGFRGTQDDRLIEVMEENGFTWGGRWLLPDPMHFEWARFP